MHLYRNLLLLTITTLSLTACADKYSHVMRTYEDSSITYNKFSEIHYETIDVPSVTSKKIDSNSPIYEFDTGKSYFASFKLPDHSGTYGVEITSYLIGQHIDESYIFSPTILILDKYFNKTRIIKNDVFEYFKPGFSETFKETGGIRVSLKGKIIFTNENNADKYMLIYTEKIKLDSHLKKETTNVIPVIVAGIIIPVPSGKREVNIPYSPTGQIKITSFLAN